MNAINKIKELIKSSEFKDEIIEEIFDLSKIDGNIAKSKKGYKLLKFIDYSNLDNWDISSYFSLKSSLTKLIEELWYVSEFNITTNNKVDKKLIKKLIENVIVHNNDYGNVDSIQKLKNFIILLEYSATSGKYIYSGMGYLDIDDIKPYELKLLRKYLKYNEK